MTLRWIFLGSLFFGSALAQAPDNDAQPVLDCVAKNVPEQSFRQAALLTITDASGASREIRANFAGMRSAGGILLNIGVEAPPDVAGTSVLLRRDENGRESIKLYLPALRRVRTVTGSMASQGILGTDFSYQDVKDIFGALREGQVELLPEPAEAAVHRLSIKPGAAQASAYESITTEVSKSHCVPMLLQFHTAQQGISKIMQGDPESLHQDGERFMLLRYRMQDVIRGSHTDMHLGLPVVDERISRSAFNPSSFYNFHNRVEAPDEGSD